jgi:hypothetical protein
MILNGARLWRYWRKHQRLQCSVSEVPCENRKRTNAGASTHHPQTEKRLGPLLLRMTGHFMLWTYVVDLRDWTLDRLSDPTHRDKAAMHGAQNVVGKCLRFLIDFGGCSQEVGWDAS